MLSYSTRALEVFTWVRAITMITEIMIAITEIMGTAAGP
jgi:hypothetical protein